MKEFLDAEIDFLGPVRSGRQAAGRIIAVIGAGVAILLMIRGSLQHATDNINESVSRLEAQRNEMRVEAELKRSQALETTEARELNSAREALSYAWANEFRALDRALGDKIAILSWSSDRSGGEARLSLVAESTEALIAALDRLNGADVDQRWYLAQVSRDEGKAPFVVQAVLLRTKK